MKFKYYILLILLLYSCRKPLDIDKDFSDTKPVLNCYFSPKDSVFISLTRSMSPLSYSVEKFEVLQNPQIEIYENNNLLDVSFIFENDFYKAQNFHPKANFNYQIKVTTENNDIIEAGDSIVSTIPIINMSYEKYTDEFGYIMYKVFTNFTDPKEIINYYWLNLSVMQKSDNWWISYCCPIYSTDPKIDEWNENKYNYLIFTDEKINGLDNSIYFEVFPDYDSTRVIARLNSISVNLYNFLKTYNEQTENIEINNPLEEPTPIFSNVTGGLGIFGAYNSSIDTLIFATENNNF
jgi:hypothetical protein